VQEGDGPEQHGLRDQLELALGQLQQYNKNI
jgi:hypothetical protein